MPAVCLLVPPWEKDKTSSDTLPFHLALVHNDKTLSDTAALEHLCHVLSSKRPDLTHIAHEAYWVQVWARARGALLANRRDVNSFWKNIFLARDLEVLKSVYLFHYSYFHYFHYFIIWIMKRCHHYSTGSGAQPPDRLCHTWNCLLTPNVHCARKPSLQAAYTCL